MLLYVRLKRVRPLFGARLYENIAKPLRPRDWGRLRGCNEFLGIETLRQFAQNSRCMIETTGVVGIAN